MLQTSVLRAALTQIEALRHELLGAREGVDETHPHYISLLNLRQYLILRSQDRTELQEQLFLMSLSSLGRSYAHVAASVDTLYDMLRGALGEAPIEASLMQSFKHASIAEAIQIASQNATALFGGVPSMRLSHQQTAVMVTLPSYAAEHDGALIRSLAEAGVNVFRINTAHDNPDVWRAMAKAIMAVNATKEPQARLKIFVDLAGPKIRTTAIRRIRSTIEIGSNKESRTLRIYPPGVMTSEAKVDPLTLQSIDARLCTDAHFYKLLHPGETIKLIDANRKGARITVLECTGEYALCSIDKKVFIDADSKLKHRGHSGAVLSLEHECEAIRLHVGDTLRLTDADLLGHGPIYDAEGLLVEPASIGCSYKGLFRFVRTGDTLYIDDGKIGLKVSAHTPEWIECQVTHAKPGGTLLKEERGINFPDAHLEIESLGDTDRRNLLATLDFADLYGLSFCQSAQDVEALKSLLESNGRDDIAIVAKIETKRAVAQMPAILEALLTCKHAGVMIARGDLAIEVGFRNLAIIQEKLIDICDAAHMPVIWATQVLESQMKNNLPSRAEVTDAAMAGRAECVMLNKGSFAVDTIDVLRHILHDMHLLFKKNRQLLSKETLW